MSTESSDTTQAEWPKPMTMKDHLGRVLTYDAKDAKDYADHLAAGWSAPYVHAKFPMALHGKKTTISVNSEEELAAALAKGYSETPIVEETPEEI